jgi:hypothetical protein
VVRPDAPADAIAGFEDDDRLARLAEPPGGREPGVSGTDDADVRIEALGHGREP